MKKIVLTSLLVVWCIGTSLIAWAADSTVPHHFTIISIDTAKVGEAIDITVEARDRDDKVIPKYQWSVFFNSRTDINAILPKQGQTVQFLETDKWVKKLSKALIFKKIGDQEIEVADAIDDVSGIKTIRVEAAAVTTTATGSDSISIILPENDTVLNMGDLVTVSGYGKKNSKVNIKLNGTDVGTVLVSDDGMYTKTLPSLTQPANIVVVELLDGNNKVISTAQSRFTLSNTDPIFNSLTVEPSNTVEASTGITLLVDAEPGLTEVNVNLNGSIIPLKESSSGKYSATTLAPAQSGSYSMNVSLKNNLSQWVSKNDITTLIVTEKPVTPVIVPLFKNVKVTTEGTKVIFNFSVENIPTDLVKFKIAYGNSAESLSEQILTKNASEILSASGDTYTWYIDKLEPKNYTFRIFGVKADQSLISDFSSEAISATVGTPGCMIGNVGDITVATSKEKSILSWLSVTGALSYNVYKITPAGDYEFVQNTKETQYVLFLSSWSVMHEDFGIKALCDEKTESADISKASHVQTGPGMTAILVIISAISGVLILRRKTSYGA